ncbi:MAG: hypothetical protein DRP73_02920 [Candidatus Omnitrophota bacterium]|nr:MAG: hypothetical protein DRP73_02920 [Candidatus Omnitrophota bacterium]
MFRPQRMTLINLAFLKEDFQKVSHLLMESGITEVESAEKFLVEKQGLQKIESSQLVTRARNTLNRMAELFHRMEVSRRRFTPGDLKLDIYLLDEIESQFNNICSHIDGLIARKRECETRIEELDYKSRFLSVLEDMEISPRDLSGLPHLYLRTGLLDSGDFKRLTEILEQSEVKFVFKIAGYLRGYVLLFIATFKENSSSLESALRALNFRNIEVVMEEKDLSQVLEDIELELWSLRETLVEIEQEYQKVRRESGSELSRLHWLLENNLKIYQAMEYVLQSRYNYLLSLWIPSKAVSGFRRKLDEVVGQKYELTEHPAEVLIDQKKVSYEQVPSSLKHPAFLRPFQKILSLYGWPAYLHIDPTLFMGISFIIMFGMMFADLGHGFILAILGALLWFQKKINFLREVSPLLLYCGFFSGIFGVLFGSVFGKEDIIPALWFNPSQQPMRFLELGVILGAILISLGIILNILQFLWQRRFREVLFSQWGFFSLVFYWLALFLLVGGVRYGVINLSITQLAIVLGIPLVLVTAGDLFFTRDKEKEPVEAIVKPMEILMGLLTNTISYIRVAAFGLTHMALMGSVYIIAETMGEIAMVKESIIVEGNIGVILLEGLIVFIQCLRLEYYEFFSKFFLLQGRKFRPLSIEK